MTDPASPRKTALLHDSLQLDRRARAMLKAMGVHWMWPSAPETPAASASPAAPTAPAASPIVATKRSAVPPLRPIETAIEPERAALTPSVGDPTRAAVKTDGLSWDTLPDTLQACQSCGLCEGRSGAVAGSGSTGAKWVFVVDHLPSTETNGASVGPSELKLFEAICKAMSLAPSQVYLTSLTKCRAAPGLAPKPSDVAQCLPYLHAQLAWLQPDMVVAMGLSVAQTLLPNTRTQGRALGQLRGQIHATELPGQVPAVVTYPLTAMLRNAQEKPKVWADMCLALAEVEARAPRG